MLRPIRPATRAPNLLPRRPLPLPQHHPPENGHRRQQHHPGQRLHHLHLPAGPVPARRRAAPRPAAPVQGVGLLQRHHQPDRGGQGRHGELEGRQERDQDGDRVVQIGLHRGGLFDGRGVQCDGWIAG